MKYAKLSLFIVIALTVALFIYGCAGAPEEVKEPEPEPKKEEVEEEKPQFKEVEETVQMVKRESSYYPDGVLDQYRVYTYKESGMNLLEEVLYNSEDEVEERVEYEYRDDEKISKTTYDSNGNVVSVHKYSYDENGNLVEDALYNQNDELQSISRYEYGEKGRKVKWSVYDSSESLLAYTEYIYENGKNTKIENYSPGGTMEDYFLIEYNSGGKKVKETWYDSSDEVQEYREYSYENGNLVKEVVKRGNDSIKRIIEYNNNEKGNPTKVVYKDGGENVEERVAYEYVTRTRTRRVPVE